jgi:hypothetical protein
LHFRSDDELIAWLAPLEADNEQTAPGAAHRHVDLSMMSSAQQRLAAALDNDDASYWQLRDPSLRSAGNQRNAIVFCCHSTLL